MELLRTLSCQPLVVYHGTRSVFDQILPNEIGLIHFSEARSQAEDFAQHVRGAPSETRLIGPPRVITAHLRADRVFDSTDRVALQALRADLNMDQVALEAEELSQSPWTLAGVEKWLSEGQWQILELPSVLAQLRKRADALAMWELGVRNWAVFNPDQVVPCVNPAPNHRFRSRR